MGGEAPPTWTGGKGGGGGGHHGQEVGRGGGGGPRRWGCAKVMRPPRVRGPPPRMAYRTARAPQTGSQSLIEPSMHTDRTVQDVTWRDWDSTINTRVSSRATLSLSSLVSPTSRQRRQGRGGTSANTRSRALTEPAAVRLTANTTRGHSCTQTGAGGDEAGRRRGTRRGAARRWEHVKSRDGACTVRHHSDETHRSGGSHGWKGTQHPPSAPSLSPAARLRRQRGSPAAS